MAKTRRERGFTLLEMLVVMVLLGLITGMALPAMQRWHDSVLSRTQSVAVVEALRAAAFAAGASRSDILMDADSFQPPQVIAAAASAASSPTIPLPSTTPRRVAVPLPSGWQVQRVVSAMFLSNGLCQPGLVALKTERGASLVIQVNGPVCGVALAPTAATSGS